MEFIYLLFRVETNSVKQNLQPEEETKELNTEQIIKGEMVVERRKSEGNNKNCLDLEKPNSAKQSTITKTHHTKSEDLGELIPLFD